MSRLDWERQVISIILTLSFSCAALGGDGPTPSGAVLRASGNVQVNGVGSREITTLFPGDSIQTTEDSAANIIAGGSSVLVMPNSLVKFVGHGVELTEGGDSVAVAAHQGNLTVSDEQQTSTVPEGQETTRKKKKKGGAAPAAGGTHSISGKTLAVIGGASAATVAGILVAESNKKKKCVSSANDKKCKCKKDKNGNETCEE